MKLKSLKTVLAMTAAFGIAFVGVSCKPKDKPAEGGDKAPAKEEGAKKEEAKKEAPKKEEAPKKDAAPKKEEAPKK